MKVERNTDLSRKLNITATLILLAVLTLLIGGCGGGSTVADGSGVITGTGLTGRAATGAAIANATITIKSLTGITITTTSDANGGFTSSEIKEASANTPRGPYLLRADLGSGNYLYSIAHTDNGVAIDSDSEQISINIHPYTDLIIRNWFAHQGLDIDSAFAAGPIASLPTAAEIDAISQEFLGILVEALNATGASGVTDLLASPFAIGDGFDSLLDNSSVIINNRINIIINQVVGSDAVQTPLVEDVAIDYDFTSASDTPPTIPQDLRALPASDSEAVIVWEPSNDDKGVAGYHVYRDGSLIATTAFPVYLDSGLSSGVAYSYTVAAFDGRGQSSGQTATPASLTLDTPDTTAPPSATSVVATAGSDSIQLGWTISSIDDVNGFRIYRGASGNVNTTGTPLAVVTSTEFQDFDVMGGTTYCYRITTFDAAGNSSSPTPETCATISGTTPTPSSVGFSSTNYSVNETQSSVTITVARSGDLSQAISVDYSATALSATAGVDFTETSGTLNWAATDSAAKTFSVQIAQDSQVESDETVQLALSNPSASTSLGSNATATLTITDAPTVSCIDLSPTDITTDTQLSEPCYNVTSDVSVSNNATLTIDPGVRLVFSAGARLTIDNDGLLLAIGTQAEPITFTGAMSATGYWDGIVIDSIATSMLEYAVVEYGGGTTSANTSNVTLSSGGSLSMNNSTLRHSGGYGFTASNLSGTEISSFIGNTITLNENAPLNIVADMIGDLDADNSFTGNITNSGGDKDYIQVIAGASGSDITRDQTWHDYGIDYHMPSNRTTIAASLTLSPGITLAFPADAMLEIVAAGTLNAVGTSSEPITFTGQQTTAGFWNGIQFTFNHTNNIMQHTVVEYGGGGGNAEANVGVFGSDGMLTIRDSVLRNSALNGFFFGSNITLTMENVTTTGNARPGNLDFYSLGLLDKNSSYSGNTDDRLLVTNNTSSSLTSMTIPKLDVPFYFDHTTYMHVPLILTIEPGVELQFNAGGGFNVDDTGAIVAEGTSSEPITFTGAVKTKGYWNGIQVTFSSIPTTFDYTILEYGGAPSGNTEALIGYFGNDTNGSVTNSVLRSSQTNGIWLHAGMTGDFTTGNTWEDIDGDNIYYAP